MELRRALSVLQSWFWLIAIGVLLSVGGSYLISRTLPRVYQASTTLIVGQSLQSASPTMAEISISERLAQTYAELAKRQPVLEATIANLGLAQSPDALASRIEVQMVPGTQLLEVRVSDTEPERARQVADELARQLIQQTPHGSQQPGAERRQFVEQELGDIQRKIAESQATLFGLQQESETTREPTQRQEVQSRVNAESFKLTSLRSSYSSLLNFLSGPNSNFISVVEPARLPLSPISPNVPVNLLLAAAVGLALTISVALVVEYLDDTVKSPEALQSGADLAALGLIGRIRGQNPAEMVVAAAEPRSRVAESFRTLRTSLQFFGLEEPLRTLLVTSAGAGEGKSTTVANLATVMAQAGSQVVVVDADLRRPSMHQIFNLRNAHGLSNVLLEPEPRPEQALQSTSIDGLKVLPSGPLPPNPSELLGHSRMQQVIAALKEHFDLVIFDLPPALAVTDAAVLGRQVDGILLVADHGRTKLAALNKARDELARVGGRVLGATLNRLPGGKRSSYYYEDYQAASAPEESGLRRVRHRLRELIPGTHRAET